MLLSAIELGDIDVGREMEESYTAVREAVNLAEILGQSQAGEEGRGCEEELHCRCVFVCVDVRCKQ